MKKLAIVLVVLIGLLVAADFGAAAAAEYQVSTRLRAQLKLADDPAVRINGFPFLYQALAGDYREVEVKASGVPVAELRNVEVEATLRHVRAPLSELLSGSAQNVTIDEVTGRVKLLAAEVGKLINVADLKIEPANLDELLERKPNGDPVQPTGKQPVADDKTAPVKLTGSTDIAGTRTQVTVVGVLSLVENQIEVSPKRLRVSNETGEVPLPPAVDRLIRRAFSTRIDPGGLPFTVVPTGVRAEHGALVVEGSAKNVQLGGGAVPNRGGS
ncbi:DUF2993 domain-containing protein [Crossiella sp. SN42]|uniref:LmeA family phospholipid-binding protein n=1 Tax=Crossiella sp. SN42 TaxID=2944808 RepID=UPI00207C8BA5|nr:DUF2993 domain-containing protein [Crossiella sp. SN42]MCO1579436.1 DUF2993 domain-containing protein [Crossiella sp. SN42]